MENLGISVNSAYNGVGLRKRVHCLTNSRQYEEAISKNILEFTDPEEAVQFLNHVARNLSDLNQYVDDPELLNSEIARFLTGIG